MADVKTLSVRLEAQIQGYLARMGAAGTATEGFGKKVDRNVGLADTRLKTLGRSSAAGLGPLTRLAQGAGVTVGILAVGAALSGLTRTAAEFEANMRNVNSISGLSEHALAGLSAQVVDLSKSLPQSAGELSAGLYDVASSGFQGADGMKVLKAAAVAASAGLSSTAVAGKGITAVLNAYGLTANSAADVSDTLFQTVNLGVLSFDELAGGIGDFVGSAAALNVPIDQASAALATMTLSGISAAESSTALNAVFSAFIKPTDAMVSTLQSLGYESGATAIQTDGLQAVMLKLRGATGGSVEELGKLFGDIRGNKGALALLANDGANWAKVAGQITDQQARAGATGRVLAEQSKSLSFQWQIFKNNVVAFALAGEAHVLPVLTAILSGLLALGHGIAPVAGEFAHLAGLLISGAAALAQYEVVVIALAAVLAGTLAPAAIKAAVSLGETAYLRALYAMSALTSGAGGLRTALAGLATGGGAAAVALTVAIGAGVVVWQQYKKAAEDAKAAVSKVAVKFDPGDANSLAETVAGLDGVAENAREAERSIGFWNKGVGPFAASQHRLQDTLKGVAATQADVRAEQDRYNSSISGASALLNLSAGQVKDLAKAAGVDLKKGFADTAQPLSTFYQNLRKGTPASQRLATAVASVGSASSTAEDKVKGFSDALSALIGIPISVDEAVSRARDSIDALSESAKTNGTRLDQNTAAHRANRQAVRDGIKSAIDLGNAVMAQGGSQAAAAQVAADYAGRVRSAAVAAGMNKAEVDKLIGSLRATPRDITTAFTTPGLPAARAGAQGLKRDMDALHDKSVTLTVVRADIASGDPGLRKGGSTFNPNASGDPRLPGHAGGGRIQAGELSTISERGFEGFKPDYGSGAGTVQVIRPNVSGVVIPHAQMVAAGYGPTGSAPTRPQVVEVNRGPLIGELHVHTTSGASAADIAHETFFAANLAARSGGR